MMRKLTLILCLLVASPAAPAQAGFGSQIMSAVTATAGFIAKKASVVASRAAWELDCMLEDTDFIETISVFALCFTAANTYFKMLWTQGFMRHLSYRALHEGWPSIVEQAGHVRVVPLYLRISAANALVKDPQQGPLEAAATSALFTQEEKETRPEYKELAQSIQRRTVSKQRPLTPAQQMAAYQHFNAHILPAALDEAFPPIPEQ